MIIAKSAFRVTLGGSSLDYPSYFRKFGPVISTGFTLKKYCYVNLTHLPNINDTNFQVAYSQFERIKSITDILNPGVRGTLEYYNNIKILDKIAIHIINELPTKSGVGSSSCLISALGKAIYSHFNLFIDKKQLAKNTIFIERELLKESGGWVDQILTSFGGLVSVTFTKDGQFSVKPLAVSTDFVNYFKNSCVLYFTNEKDNSRNSYEVAKSYENLNALSFKHEILRLGHEIKYQMESENLENVGKLVHETWENKKKISNLISNAQIDSIYEKILDSGALGGRVMGAGSAGFIFTIYPSPEKKTAAVKDIGISYIDVDIDYDGTSVIFNQE